MVNAILAVATTARDLRAARNQQPTLRAGAVPPRRWGAFGEAV